MNRVTRASFVLSFSILASAACGSTESTDGETTIAAIDPGAKPSVIEDAGTALAADARAGAPVTGDAGATTPVVVTTGSLRVKVEGLQSTNGKFAWALFNQAGASGFPDSARYREARIRPTATAFTLDFDQLPPGRYALSVYHDTDSNDELNKGVFGQPTERWGSTNNVTHTFSGPTFDESAVDVQKGFRTTTKVVLHD